MSSNYPYQPDLLYVQSVLYINNKQFLYRTGSAYNNSVTLNEFTNIKSLVDLMIEEINTVGSCKLEADSDNYLLFSSYNITNTMVQFIGSCHYYYIGNVSDSSPTLVTNPKTNFNFVFPYNSSDHYHSRVYNQSASIGAGYVGYYVGSFSTVITSGGNVSPIRIDNDSTYFGKDDFFYALLSRHFTLHFTPYTPNYTITVTSPVHGTITTYPPNEADENETVVVTHTPDVGYITNLANTTVKDVDNNDIIYTLLTPTTFQFTMPASDVTINVEFKSNNPYIPGGESAPSTPGGDGEFNNNSDSIPIPVTPPINYSDSGLVRLFSPTAQQIIDFGNYLWSGLIDLDTIIKAYQDPMQNIISFHMVPIAVDKTDSIAVKFAGISTSVNMYPVTKQIYDVSMGSLQFPKYYGSSLDYSPYTQAVLYLPYIGEIPLDVDECIGKTLSISYKIDVFSGNCVAFVAIDGNVFYMKSGNVLQTIPISQSSFSQIIGTATGLLASALGGTTIIGGGIGALGAGTVIGGIGNLISQSASIASQAVKPASDLLSVIAGKPQSGHTSLGGGITGYLSIQYPYINIKRVKQSLASSYASEYGYPLNVTGNLRDYTGFVKISDIVFNGMTSTDVETGEIYNLLRSGIVIYNNELPVYTAPSNGLKIALEYYTGVPNSPDKPIVTKAEITGTLRNGTDLTRPTVFIEGYFNTLLNETNIICIPEFKRRYYIKEIRVITANSYEIDLICDVLTSFWDEFKTSLCIIERAQNSYNLMIRDNLFVGQQDRLIQQLKFPESFSTQSYILALTGNNGSGT